MTLIPFGRAMREQFMFDDGWTNLNHGEFALLLRANVRAKLRQVNTTTGSYGTYPKSVRKAFHAFQAAQESRPDEFIRHKALDLHRQSRQAVASLVNAPLETITFVQNATTGINVVLRNLEYEPGDVILTCENIYGACDKTVQYLCQTTAVESVHYTPTLPLTEDDLVAGFEAKIRHIVSESDGTRRVKVALFDAISSMPAARWPWERLVQACKDNGVLSCIDGAHGIGAIELDLSKSDPDFFVSNCHK